MTNWDVVRHTAVTDVQAATRSHLPTLPAKDLARKPRRDQGEPGGLISKRAAKRAMQKGKDHQRKVQRVEEQRAGRKGKGKEEKEKERGAKERIP